MDIYIVIDCGRVVGASAKLQGAELIRVDEARRQAADSILLGADRQAYERVLQHGMRIVNVELQDVE